MCKKAVVRRDRLDPIGVPARIVSELERDGGPATGLRALVGRHQLADHLGLRCGGREEKSKKNQTASCKYGHRREQFLSEQNSGQSRAL